MIPREVHAEAEAIFRKLMDYPREEWNGRLQKARAERPAVVNAVDALIAAFEAVDDFMESPAEAPDLETIHFDGHEKSTRHSRLDLPGFRMLELIGAGGMGAVYLAEQVSPRRRVAVKLIRADLVQASALRRFEIEAELLGRLEHPNIARIYATGRAPSELGEQPYFVMEWVDGRPLLEALEGSSTRKRVETLVKVCAAVHHAHQKGIVHRDLKPGNILIDTDEEPRILDFGIAKLTVNDGSELTGGTSTGQLLGTLPYMSPEQVSGDPAAVDTRSDLYSLGIVGYELLAGQLPYHIDSRDIFGAAHVIRDETGIRLGQHSSQYRGDLDNIFVRALEKEPDRRYSSARCFADDLIRYLNDEPIEARPPSRSYQAWKFVRRQRVLVGSVATVLVALVAALGISLTLLRETRDQKQRAEASVENLRRAAAVMIGPLLDAIENEPQSTPKRRGLLNEAIFILEQLVADPNATDVDRLNFALAYERLADLQSEDNGEVDASYKSLLKARKICAGLLEEGEPSPEVYLVLTEVLDEQARFYSLHKQDPVTAKGILDDRARRVEELRTRYPDHPGGRLIHHEGVREEALVQARSGDIAGAIKKLEALVEEFDPEGLGADGQRERMIACWRLGSMLSDVRRREDAVPFTEIAYEIAMSQRDIDERQRLIDVMQTTKLYVRLRAELGQTDGNDELRAQMLAAADALLAREPTSLQSRARQAFVTSGAAESLYAEHRFDEAEAQAYRYLELSRELVEADPGNANSHRGLTVGEALLAQICKARGDTTDDAAVRRASYQQAGTHADKALQHLQWRETKNWVTPQDAQKRQGLLDLKKSVGAETDSDD